MDKNNIRLSHLSAENAECDSIECLLSSIHSPQNSVNIYKV